MIMCSGNNVHFSYLDLKVYLKKKEQTLYFDFVWTCFILLVLLIRNSQVSYSLCIVLSSNYVFSKLM